MTWFALYITVAWLLRLAMLPVILRRHLAPGASLAWLLIIFLHPYIGSTLYAFLGETRLGAHRIERQRQLTARYRPPVGMASGTDGSSSQYPSCLPIRHEPMVRQAERIGNLPVVSDNHFELLTDSQAVVARLVADIDAATATAHLLYYIFADDATGRPVLDALKRAAARGVACRLLLDAVGARACLRFIATELTAANVQVAAALPAHIVQRRLPRMDLRNHRKLAVIDSRVAYVGSHNLINPDYDHSPAAPWHDLTARVTGPITSHLSNTFAEDWELETGEELGSTPLHATEGQGALMQLVPTGPVDNATYRRVLLAAIQSARVQLTLTTPYFVPDEPTLVALVMAADRGVTVRLILPERPDHFFTAAAGRAHFSRLLEAGVQIHLFRPGLLHSKTATVDDSLGLLGSANLDVRSFNLNFELTLLLYGGHATHALHDVQASYLSRSRRLTIEEWGERRPVKRLADSAISLLSPLL